MQRGLEITKKNRQSEMMADINKMLKDIGLDAPSFRGIYLDAYQREIAELVNCRHDKVRQSIERLVDRGTIAQPPMGDVQEVGGNNRIYTTQEYFLDERSSYIVVAQLSPEFTARLVDR